MPGIYHTAGTFTPGGSAAATVRRHGRVVDYHNDLRCDFI